MPFHPAINEKSETSAGYPACDRKPKNCGLSHSGLKKRLKFEQRLIAEGQRLLKIYEENVKQQLIKVYFLERGVLLIIS